MIFDALVPEMEKLVIFVFTVEHTDPPHNVSHGALECVKRHHTQLRGFFCFVLFLLALLQQVFCN